MRNIFLILLTVSLFSCRFSFNFYKPIETKYREKDQIDVLKVNASFGDIGIIGWSKNFIEIKSIKKLISGFPTDRYLLETNFIKNNNELTINAKIPSRVKGTINLVIYIPVTLYKVYVSSQNGIISIDKYLGDIELVNETGDININYYGSILRITTNSARIYLNIFSQNSTDIVINNENGNNYINLANTAPSSFFDINSVNGNIDLIIPENIRHNLNIITKNNNYYSYYEFDKNSSITESYNYLRTNKNGYDIDINIFEINGKINIMNK